MAHTKPFPATKRMVWEAWKKVKANGGSAGVDGQTLEAFGEDLGNNLYKVWNRMADAVCHCRSERQAVHLRRELERRFAQCKLRLHPDKTRIVYCKDGKRRRTVQARNPQLSYPGRAPAHPMLPHKQKNRTFD